MRNYLFFALCINFMSLVNSTNISEKDMLTLSESQVKEIVANKFNQTISPEFRDLIAAIIYIESSNGKHTVNTKEDAVGPMQLRQSIVSDCNRISGKDLFTLDDRNDLFKSIEMFMIYQKYYNPELDVEKAARIWNGGPKGCSKSKTLAYWSKVNKIMNNDKMLAKSIINTSDFKSYLYVVGDVS
jgi:hypothetical protein